MGRITNVGAFRRIAGDCPATGEIASITPSLTSSWDPPAGIVPYAMVDCVKGLDVFTKMTSVFLVGSATRQSEFTVGPRGFRIPHVRSRSIFDSSSRNSQPSMPLAFSLCRFAWRRSDSIAHRALSGEGKSLRNVIYYRVRGLGPYRKEIMPRSSE